MVVVKICGVTTLEDALASAEAGADMLGLNFFKRSPRYIEPEAALMICDTLRERLGAKCPVLVGVFVNDSASTISEVMAKVGLDAVQLSGDESDDVVKELRGKAYKGIRPPNKALALEDARYYVPFSPTNLQLPSLLLDAYHPDLYGGTGEQASEEVAQAVKDLVPRLMLAGGLTPDNVLERVRAIQPWGVDVASGVEPPDQPGVKDLMKVRAFIDAVRSVSTMDNE